MIRADQAHKFRLSSLALGPAFDSRSVTASVNVLFLLELEEFGVARLAGHDCGQVSRVFKRIPTVVAFAKLLSSSTDGQVKARLDAAPETYVDRAKDAISVWVVQASTEEVKESI